MESKIFISFSHKDRSYRDELLPALKAVGAIRDRVWFDQQNINIGDQFHQAIQQALAKSKLAILLVSNHFLTSDYITQHELPFLLRQAERGALKLGILYVSAVAETALSVTIEIDGKPNTINLADTIGVNSPAKPLDKMSHGDRNAVYARAAEWAVRQLASAPPPAREPTGSRHDLAIFIQARRDHWQHQFFLPTSPSAIKPKLDCPEPALVLGYDLDGEMLFQLLFGSDPTTAGQLLALAFGTDRPADPTYAPLRVRLITDDSRLHVLPWGNISYQGRALAQAGWTVELHAKEELGFPGYPQHLCYFPGRVVLAGSAESGRTEHFHDLRRLFQRHWPENPDPVLVTDAKVLRAALQAGSTRLVYYYGPASRNGLLLQDRTDGECVPWLDFAKWLKQSQSVSVLFLNLVGETGFEALEQGAVLLDGVKGTVLVQCNPRTNAHIAAKAGLAWLDAVFCRRLDPVVALHQQASGHITAWTRYSQWEIESSDLYSPHPDLVNLLLNRHRQRDTLLGAKEEFYDYPKRYIHHVVAQGSPGCRTSEFPAMIKQHLAGKKRGDKEAYFFHSIDLTTDTDNVQRVDDLVRRRFHRSRSKSLLDGLIDPNVVDGLIFCFLVLGWNAKSPNKAMLHAVADWCRNRLGTELGGEGWQAKVRIISIFALESEQPIEIENTVKFLIKECNKDPSFNFGRLDRLGAVLNEDLLNYFRGRYCHCDDRYREDFPDLLLADREEMPFDEAVATIRRGEPDNWGNLYDELTTMKNTGTWPPPHYDPNFWSKRDGR